MRGSGQYGARVEVPDDADMQTRMLGFIGRDPEWKPPHVCLGCGVTTTPARSRATLTGISSRAWEHPADRGALVALRKLKGFDTVLKAMSGLVNERAVRLALPRLGGARRRAAVPGLHRLLGEVGRTLDVAELPEMFVGNNPVTGAMTIGMDKPIIVLNSALLDLLDEEELRFVVAHELGHAMSGHAVYQTLLQRLLQPQRRVSALDPRRRARLPRDHGGAVRVARKSELSADRAGLLATQDPATAFRVHMKLASGRRPRTSSTRRRSSPRARSTSTPATCATRCSSCC